MDTLHFKITQCPAGVNFQVGQTISFETKSKITLGRDESCDVVFDCPDQIISRQHAVISKADFGYVITDTSANGTYLNDQTSALGRDKSTPLSNNDQIHIGAYSLSLSFQKQSQETNHKIIAFPRHEPKAQEALSSPLPQEQDLVEPELKPKITESAMVQNNFIPENWDVELENETSPALDTAIALRTPIDFSGKEALLAQGLYDGLSLPKNGHNSHLSVTQMHLLGQSLLTCIEGLLQQKQYLDSIKKKFCFHDEALLKICQTEYTIRFKETEDLTKRIFDTEKNADLPAQIAAIQANLMEDQVAIIKTLNIALTSMTEELSPTAINKAHTKAQKKVFNTMVPLKAKWQIYSERWHKYCRSYQDILKTHFRANIKKLHQKRIDAKKTTSKD